MKTSFGEAGDAFWHSLKMRLEVRGCDFLVRRAFLSRLFTGHHLSQTMHRPVRFL